MTRKDRNKNLKTNFYFECHCSACIFSNHSVALLQDFLHLQNSNNEGSEDDLWNIFMKKEDSYRSRASQLDSLILEMAEEDANVALDMALELVKILLLKSNQLWSVRYLSDAYLYVYHISMSLDRKEQAYNALKEAHEWNVRLQGIKTPDTRRTFELLYSFNAR